MRESRQTEDTPAAHLEESVRAVFQEVELRLLGLIQDIQRKADDERQTTLSEARAAADAELARVVAAEVSRAKAEADATARQDMARARAEAVENLSAEVAFARIEERQAVLAGIDRLLRSMRRLDEATSLTDVLDALADGAREEAARVALIVAQSGDRAQVWRSSGFGPGFDGRRDLPVAELGIVMRAMQTGELSTQSGPSYPGGTYFPHVPQDRVALAVPVRLAGRVVAALYADDAFDGERSVPTPWPEVLEILARHGGRCLESLTALRAVQGTGRARAVPASYGVASHTPASPIDRPAAAAMATSSMDDEARRYAYLLVNEIRKHHEGSVIMGRQQRDLLQRLQPQIEQARRIYEEQVPASIPARRLYFDQELLRTLANGDPTLLG